LVHLLSEGSEYGPPGFEGISMIPDRIRQQVLQRQNRLLAAGAQEAATMRYWIRQQYDLPPTDERYLALTDEQIALEYYAYLAASGARVCSRCGAIGTDRFCVQCGNALDYGLTKKCPNERCGGGLAPESWNYCPMCGTELEMHVRYDPYYQEWAEGLDLGKEIDIDDDRRWKDV
jgi:hypothetical protein